MFQSTRPCGARRDSPGAEAWCIGVSIHAPVRGATSSRRLWRWIYSGFNPRARAGRDVTPVGSVINALSFNPRARAGRDKYFDNMFVHDIMFQSTRPCGARPNQHVP